MGIYFRERFRVSAPIDRVWQYLLDPHQVVTCMPGAELVEVKDERTFVGRVRVQVGPIQVSYMGQIRLEEVDDNHHRVRMVGEGRESGGAGSARLTMTSSLTPVDGETEVMVEANMELTGRIVQFGRGMVEDIAREMFQRFSECVRKRLESPAVDVSPSESTIQSQAIRALPLMLRTFWRALLRSLRRILRYPFSKKG